MPINTPFLGLSLYTCVYLSGTLVLRTRWVCTCKYACSFYVNPRTYQTFSTTLYAFPHKHVCGSCFHHHAGLLCWEEARLGSESQVGVSSPADLCVTSGCSFVRLGPSPVCASVASRACRTEESPLPD